MINLYHELEDPLKMLEESRRLLKKGGKLMIIDWKKGETPEGPPLELRLQKLHRVSYAQKRFYQYQ